ncbi:MAG: ribosome maturation factor RimM [Candidatus Zixiibacteriota bacterium]
MPEISRVTIGKISRVRGTKGEMVVIPLTDDPGRFVGLGKVTVSSAKRTGEFVVEQAREFKGKVLLKLKQVLSPEAAEELVGGFIEIDREELVRLPEGRYFVFDLIGLEVTTTDGQKVGKVKEVISLPAHDIYVVEGKTRLYDIPAVRNVIKNIDLNTRQMIIQPQEGLLEL